MSDLSIVVNEQVNLKILKDNPEYLLKYDNNYFLSDIGKDLFEIFKNIYFDKQMSLSNENIIIYGNEVNKDINNDLLDKLSKIVYDIEKFDIYYKKLKEEYIKEDTRENILNEIMIESNSKNDLDIDKLETLSTKLQTNISILRNKTELFKTPEQMILNYEQELISRLEGSYYSMGCSYLDRYLVLGARPSYMTAIFASTGLAKSSYSLYLDNKRINKGIPSLHIALENDNYLTTERVLSMRFKESVQNFCSQDHHISDQFKYLIEKERKKLSKHNKFLFVEEPSLSISDLENIIIEAKKIMGVNYLVCTVDLASMLSDFGTKPEEIERSMNKLHIIARRQNIHFILVIQANRETDKAPIKTIDDISRLKPVLNNIKNSNAIAERCRVVLGLFRRKHYMKQYFPDHPLLEVEDDILETLILKQNSGSLGNLKYVYFPEYTYFVPLKEENKNE